MVALGLRATLQPVVQYCGSRLTVLWLQVLGVLVLSLCVLNLRGGELGGFLLLIARDRLDLDPLDLLTHDAEGLPLGAVVDEFGGEHVVSSRELVRLLFGSDDFFLRGKLIFPRDHLIQILIDHPFQQVCICDQILHGIWLEIAELLLPVIVLLSIAGLERWVRGQSF